TAERFLFFPINAAISNPVIPTNLHSVIPTKVGIRNVKSQKTVLSGKFARRQARGLGRHCCCGFGRGFIRRRFWGSGC
ncbi:hypothetical protein F7O82_09185, partial [Neisseria meningitidis]|nr:hypothetical protein [Neisseria meningitidis]